MRSVFCIALIAALLSGGPLIVSAGSTPVPGKDGDATGAEPPPEEIIKKFSEKETEFFEAWKRYTYRQIAKLKVLSVDGVPKDETMMLVYEVVFTDEGYREIRKVKESGWLDSVIFTSEDEEVIVNLLPFALTVEDLPKYDLRYRGKERVDELDCYVFSVRPRKRNAGGFQFEGKIWVDDVDLQIVRTLGRVVAEKAEGEFPEFETLRGVVDGKYWFPVWTHAREVLHFRDPFSRGQYDAEVEETITYEGYKEFKSKSTIRYGKRKVSGEESE